MRPPQHDKAHTRTDRNQDQSYDGQKRCEKEGNDDLRSDNDQRRGELHYVVRRRADAVNVTAHQVGNARMLQARYYRPGSCGEPPGEAGADGFDKAHFDPRQRDVAAGNDNRPDDHQSCK